jgi:biopolymer transport protein ExbB
MDLSLWEILNLAGYAMWLIVAFSVLAIAIALERGVAHWRFMDRATMLADTVNRCITRGALDEGRTACSRSKSPLADVFLVGYERLGRTKRGALEAAVNRERVRVIGDLKARSWILGTIGATAPFVGLFGTVVGIMTAFGDISAAGGGGIDVVSGGIAEALYATAAGILVAVEAVIIYNYFNQRVSRIAIETRMLTDEFLELLDEHGPERGKGTKKATKTTKTTKTKDSKKPTKSKRSQDEADTGDDGDDGDGGDDDGDREAA